MDIEEIRRRRAAERAARRRRRVILAAVACAAVAALLVTGYVKLRPDPKESSNTAAAQPGTQTESAAPQIASTPIAESASPAAPTLEPTPTTTPSSAKTFVAKKPRIAADYIPFGAERRQQMAEYSQRRYGDSSTALKPRVIVLHYTAGGTAQGAHDLFAANQPNGGELPGVVAHFIVDKDGGIYQELPLDTRGRHAIGLNHVSIGIEFVQDGGSGPEWADQQILHRDKQMAGGLALVAWLQAKYGIADRDVIGHASADDHRYFKDLAGMHNDHGDWLGGDVAQFRKALRLLRDE
jgi:hypothetical protein